MTLTEYRVPLPPIGNGNQRLIATEPLLTAQECAALLDHARADGWADAAVSRPSEPGGIVDRAIRSARLRPLPLDGSWPFSRLVDRIAMCNSTVYRYDLRGIYESDAPAIARYSASDTGQFRAHVDAGALHSTRKLSYVVQLDHSGAYAGGDLYFSELAVSAPREQGSLVLFPSTLTHCVTPVITGTRHVIVGWIHGTALR